MFNRDAEPIANMPPYKRVSINDPQPGDPNIAPLTTAEICENLMKQHEAARIWQLVKQCAEGTCAPMASEYVAPSDDAA